MVNVGELVRALREQSEQGGSIPFVPREIADVIDELQRMLFAVAQRHNGLPCWCPYYPEGDHTDECNDVRAFIRAQERRHLTSKSADS